MDLDVIQKLDAIFYYFPCVCENHRHKLCNAQELLRKDAEEFDWETCKIETEKNEIC